MPTTVEEGFKKLIENISTADIDQSVVSARQQEIVGICKNNIKIEDTFIAGSYLRNTLIPPVAEADIDIFLVLDNEHFLKHRDQQGGQAELLGELRLALKPKYNQADISKNGQAVTIALDKFKLDLIPTFRRAEGGLFLPSSLNGSWIITDPKVHVLLVERENKEQNGKLLPLIKMVKIWNRYHGSFFFFFHLEAVSLRIFKEVNIDDYPSGFRYFFDSARNHIKEVCPDPAGFGGNVGYYLNTQAKIDKAVSLLEEAFTISNKAENEGLNTFTSVAYHYWPSVFGEYFPTYGDEDL
ncbi:hypothetical protein HY045_01555 [Candidatus Woesebacteria bacterium]|nr:hypothetical protein [Candidatus Woesebacteria bacterium]